VERFVPWMDLTGDKRRLDAYFPRLGTGKAAAGGGSPALAAPEPAAPALAVAAAAAAAAEEGARAGGDSCTPGWSGSSGSDVDQPLAARSAAPRAGSSGAGGGNGSSSKPRDDSNGGGGGGSGGGGGGGGGGGCNAAVEGGEFALDGVDAQQQARLLEEIARQQRLRASLAARDAARAAKRRKRAG
jgi:hypothetical protein